MRFVANYLGKTREIVMPRKTKKTKAKTRRAVAKRAAAGTGSSHSYWSAGAGLLGVAIIVGAAAFVYMNDDARNRVVGMVDNINLESVNLPNAIPFFSGEEASGRS